MTADPAILRYDIEMAWAGTRRIGGIQPTGPRCSAIEFQSLRLRLVGASRLAERINLSVGYIWGIDLSSSNR
jgi:hypothetical protein